MDLTRKAHFVAGGHMTKTPSSLTYSSVVSRDSVRIAFLIAALNDLNVLSCDIGNAYLNAACHEKIWFVAGPEFGQHKIGTVQIIEKALYVLKSSGAAWHDFFASSIKDIGFATTKADPGVYRRQAVTDGFEYYEYLLAYVDDVIVVSHKAEEIMESIVRLYRLKEKPTKPEIFLGADIKKWDLTDGRSCWAMSAGKYLKRAMSAVENMHEGDGMKLAIRREHPSPPDTVPKSMFCLNSRRNTHNDIISLLVYIAIVGRIGKDRHHDQSFHDVVAQCITPLPNIDSRFAPDTHDCTPFYENAYEETAPRMPKPLGNPVSMYCSVDSDHTRNLLTRKSQTGFLVYLKCAPIIWYIKRQNTVESSSFGSEFVTMRQATDSIEALRYKLRMFGIPKEGPCIVYGDNQSVITNSSVPESTLQKKNNSICYHQVRHAVAAKMIEVVKIDT